MTGFLMSFNSYKELINAKYSSESLRVQKKTLERVGAEWQQVTQNYYACPKLMHQQIK